MSEDYKHTMLTKEFDRYNDLHAQNLINQDNVLVQLSVAILAILGTLGRALLTINRALGYIVVSFLAVTILQVVIGYFISNKFFESAKSTVNSNYENGVEPINKNLDRIVWGKINSVLNITQAFTFLIGMAAFVVLLIIYIGKRT